MDKVRAYLAAGPRRPAAAVAGGAVLAIVAVLAGTGPANAAAPISVDCATTDLQAAISTAPPGATLDVTGTCTGTFSIGTSLNLAGQGAAELNGTGNPAAATVTISTGVTVRLANLTITGGGGGIDNNGTATVDDSPVTGNGGFVLGGIRNNGTLTLDDSPVTGNGARTGGPVPAGGGIYNGGTLTLHNSPVTGNVARTGGGIDNNGTATLDDSQLTANHALIAGGIHNSGTLTLHDSPVTGNTAGLQIAGGILNGGTITLHDSPVTGNTPDNCSPPGSVADCSG